MRTWLWLLAVAAACGSSAPPATTTATPPTSATGAPGITVSPELERELRSGMPVAIEIVDDEVVATCTVSFDLWDEKYIVKHGDTDKTKAPDLRAALTACLGTEPISALTARAAPGVAPDPLKRAPEPVF